MLANIDATAQFSDPESAALIALDALHHGQPYEAPIDPVVIARSLDIDVWGNDALESSLSGMIAKVDPASGAPVDLVVNTQHNPARQRFTIAHELGHYFDMLRKHPELDVQFMFKRDSRSACGIYSDEIYANKFAASLLMPRPLVEEHLERGYNIAQMASSFNVSIQAMSHRLTNLGLQPHGA